MTDEPSRFRVIEGGHQPKAGTKPEKRRKPSGRPVTERLHVCGVCNVSSLVQHRLGGMDVNGKLKGGSLHWCCAQCFRPYYLIRSFD